MIMTSVILRIYKIDDVIYCHLNQNVQKNEVQYAEKTEIPIIIDVFLKLHE